ARARLHALRGSRSRRGGSGPDRAGDRQPIVNGGRITVETATVDLDERDASQHPGKIRGPHVMLRITDTGTGMDADTRSRIFEPFLHHQARRTRSRAVRAVLDSAGARRRGATPSSSSSPMRMA